jgi:hypothetical protein
VSLPSYELSRVGARWWCSGVMPETGKPFRFDVGGGSRDRADGVAQESLRRKVASSKGSRARWDRARALKRGTATTAAPGEGTATVAADVGGGQQPAPQPAPPPTSPRVSDDELRAKLLALGDARPIEPDRVLPAGDAGAAGAAADPENDDPPMDESERVIVAAAITGFLSGFLINTVNKRLARRNPPEHAEPLDMGKDWFEAGTLHYVEKAVGRSTSFGPFTKLVLGGLVMVGSMYATAAPIDPRAQPRPAPAAAPDRASAAAPDPPTAAPQNGHQAPIATTALALGSFGSPSRGKN